MGNKIGIKNENVVVLLGEKNLWRVFKSRLHTMEEKND